MKLDVLDPERCIVCQSCMFACSRRAGAAGLSQSCIGVRSAGGMAKGFVIVVCRACADPPCAKVCPTGALVPRTGGGVKLNASACIGCGHCKQACVLGAIFWDDESNKPMICVHCGYCAGYCPYDVLGVDRSKGGEL